MNFSRIFTSLYKLRLTPRLTSPELNFKYHSVVNNKHVSIPQHCCSTKPKYLIHTKTTEEESFIHKIIKYLPITLSNISKTKLKANAYFHYEAIADKLNYVEFFDELDLPDTFYSWFVITELHLWMLSVRAMAENTEGRLIRNNLVEALWADVGQRVKKIGAVNPAEMRTQISELSEQLQAAYIAYDEGLQSDDIVLAGALWRRIYQQKDIDCYHLELLVKYIRRQINMLENISSEEFFQMKHIQWDSIKS